MAAAEYFGQERSVATADRSLLVSSIRPLAALRGLYAGRRLLVCAVAGLIVFLLLPAACSLPLRAATAWVLGVALFLWLTFLAAGDASPEYLRRRAERLDERRWVILALIVAAAGTSLFALGFLLQKETPGETSPTSVRVTLAGLTVVASWLLTHSIFAAHYAHEYYGDADPGPGRADRGGLAFPGETAPDYWDFLYYSFVVGMTCQVSDVQVTARRMRRLTLAHGIVSFIFNTVVLALAVNILASTL
jgi:uncharacterized membrane protein